MKQYTHKVPLTPTADIKKGKGFWRSKHVGLIDLHGTHMRNPVTEEKKNFQQLRSELNDSLRLPE